MVKCIIWLCFYSSFVPFLWGKRLCVRKFPDDNWKFTDHNFPLDASVCHSLIISIVCWKKREYPEVPGLLYCGLGVQRPENEIRRWWAVPPLRWWSSWFGLTPLSGESFSQNVEQIYKAVTFREALNWYKIIFLIWGWVPPEI